MELLILLVKAGLALRATDLARSYNYNCLKRVVITEATYAVSSHTNQHLQIFPIMPSSVPCSLPGGHKGAFKDTSLLLFINIQPITQYPCSSMICSSSSLAADR